MTQNNIILKPSDFPDYELLDSGNGRKLERFGKYILNRLESQAIWKPLHDEKLWHTADAVFEKSDKPSSFDKSRSNSGERVDKRGFWKKRTNIPDAWNISYKSLTFSLKLTSFGHVGIFPEQASQWDWIAEKLTDASNPTVLSLFSYTGAATLTAAVAGASVVHVDASKPAITWARENQMLSGLANKSIRWIADDALKFVKREVRRGNRYHGIIMDPPKFGRGPQGEVWKFEESILELFDYTRQILLPEGFLLITAYAVPISAITLANTMQSYFKQKGNIEYGELVLSETNSTRDLPTAIFARG